jgi:hypothetical protein
MADLHYAKLNLRDEDILVYKVKSLKWLGSVIDEITFKHLNPSRSCEKNNCVYLFAYEYGDRSEVFVTHNFYWLWIDLQRTLKKKVFNDITFFLQEYTSYQEAYKVALQMKEVYHLCYEPSEEKNP